MLISNEDTIQGLVPYKVLRTNTVAQCPAERCHFKGQHLCYFKVLFLLLSMKVYIIVVIALQLSPSHRCLVFSNIVMTEENKVLYFEVCFTMFTYKWLALLLKGFDLKQTNNTFCLF